MSKTGCTIETMNRLFLLALFAILLGWTTPVLAQDTSEEVISGGVSPVAVAIPITGPEVAYGDLVAFDAENRIYILSQYPDDPRLYGVVQEDPPIVLYADPGDVPVVRSGVALVNVTLENGPIEPGDHIIASSIPGKGMRAEEASQNSIGTAREAFTGEEAGSLAVGSQSIAAGTIAVEIRAGLGAGSADTVAGALGQFDCEPGSVTCNILQKINAAPLITLTRYLIAAAVALGALYLAFHSFMTDAVNGVISVGRNPRAKATIQAMVVFNAVLAAGIAVSGLAIGLVILFIPI